MMVPCKYLDCRDPLDTGFIFVQLHVGTKSNEGSDSQCRGMSVTSEGIEKTEDTLNV
jgi:hypothetical protein